MGQEITRARSLLAGLKSEGLLAEDVATRAYEAWAASSSEAPFSLYLLETKQVSPEALRAGLRALSVKGMAWPERFLFERFQDLLVGQLGIEAGLLSPKLLKTVRGVQDKKVAENKLRRLKELLPRAGFDPEVLALLHHHLEERVLLCPGCLGRYPRKDSGPISQACPRCGYPIRVPALEPLQQEEPSAEHQRVLLAGSDAVLASLPVSVRQRGRLTPAPQGSLGLKVGLLGLGLLLLSALLAYLIFFRQPGSPPRLPLLKDTGAVTSKSTSD